MSWYTVRNATSSIARASFKLRDRRNLTTRSLPWPSLSSLERPSLDRFQTQAFRPLLPYHLKSTFDLAASTKWIDGSKPASFNEAYLEPFGDSVYLPIELTTTEPEISFTRTTAPLSLFLTYARHLLAEAATSSTPKMYIAQASLSLLPDQLKDDMPIPDLVLRAGKGDIYDSSLWMGPSPAARTPLHRDPNPNILVQVAGLKIVRILPPDVGSEMFRKIRGQIASESSAGISTSEAMRGEEMMGKEGRLIDDEIWNSLDSSPSGACQAVLQPGDGIFIPDGWWHSIRGAEDGINISVNWWFR